MTEPVIDCPLVRCIQSEYYLKESGTVVELVDHHRRILNHVFTVNEDGELPYRNIVLSMPKKSAKTELAAMITYGFARTFGGNCYSIANDIEQSRTRMFDRVQENFLLMQHQAPELLEEVLGKDKFVKRGQQIDFADNGQRNPGPHWLRFIASDYAGEAGGMPALTVFDELWAYRTDAAERLWVEMQPIPNLPYSVRLVTTYAGWYGESHLLWNIYESVVKPDSYDPLRKHGTLVPGLEDLPCYQDGQYFCYWDHEARMPWHTPEFMAEAQKDPSLKGRESEYRRIWRNEWTTGEEAFLPMDVVDSAIQRGKEAGLVNHMANW